jgi:hypothetical protein
MSFKDVLAEVPYNNPRKPKKKPKKERVVVDKKEDTNDMGYIRKEVVKLLEALNGRNWDHWYSVSITQPFNISNTRPVCFRVLIRDNSTRKVFQDYFVEKTSECEYVFTPPLDYNSLTTESYENRDNKRVAA